MLQFSLVFMLQERGPRQKTRLMTDIITFGVGNSAILNQDGKMKILRHVACFYSKCLAKMKNERPAWQCFLTSILDLKSREWENNKMESLFTNDSVSVLSNAESLPTEINVWSVASLSLSLQNIKKKKQLTTYCTFPFLSPMSFIKLKFLRAWHHVLLLLPFSHGCELKNVSHSYLAGIFWLDLILSTLNK